MAQANTWWGQYVLPPQRPTYWAVGPLSLIAERRATEWQIGIATGVDPLSLQCIVASAEVPALELQRELRVAFRHAPEAITLQAALADRPVVVRTADALCIPPGERVTLFVSTAVWLQISFDQGPPILDQPTLRPPDTWFGPDSRTGEICYASRTRAKTDESQAGHWVSRAITPVRVRNQSATPLQIDQIKLPIPNLAAYADNRGYLWTDAVLMECTESTGAVMVRIDSRDRPTADWTRVASPRIAVGGRRIPDAFALLFGHGAP